ncbi:hypothetical protein CEXT_41161 [Caerostris extrusa]|uniref:Uncharacterized protein n=1 Tax=Caerostris extrusa TaxID=172846 RepID=A0AAV4QBY9_CAEEX|nr:hypothetical protein CEXT_41161 [Caerostris extrusa]
MEFSSSYFFVIGSRATCWKGLLTSFRERGKKRARGHSTLYQGRGAPLVVEGHYRFRSCAAKSEDLETVIGDIVSWTHDQIVIPVGISRDEGGWPSPSPSSVSTEFRFEKGGAGKPQGNAAGNCVSGIEVNASPLQVQGWRSDLQHTVTGWVSQR